MDEDEAMPNLEKETEATIPFEDLEAMPNLEAEDDEHDHSKCLMHLAPVPQVHPSEPGALTKEKVVARLDEFAQCGRSAQLLYLEHKDVWRCLNDWLMYAISSRDFTICYDLLDVLEKMPTSSSKLTTAGEPLTQTVQKLLKVDADGVFAENKYVGAIKAKCIGLKHKWQVIKSTQVEERDSQRVEFIAETGNVGWLVPYPNNACLVYLNQHFVHMKVTFPIISDDAPKLSACAILKP